jgi:CDP-diacylglycerol--serine O-phosphatidyltransferase
MGKLKRPSRRVRSVFLLPSLLTAGNMVCGVLAIQNTMHGNFPKAAWYILVAVIFDSLDGKIARLSRTVSMFGINFDSLADLTSFGIAPAMLMYSLPYQSDARISVFIIFALCSALRLARYNVQAVQEMKGDFTGLPTPAAASVMAASYLMLSHARGGEVSLFDQQWVYFGLHMLALVLACLMVSRIRYPNLGHLKVEGRKPFNYLVAAVVLIGVAAVEWRIAIFLAAWSYLISGLFGYALRRRKARMESEAEVSETIAGEARSTAEEA